MRGAITAPGDDEGRDPGRNDVGTDGMQHGPSRLAAARPLDFGPAEDRLNHNVFRYPAKFHPPVARSLVDTFSRPGERILDPFCGSGTLMIEAVAAGRDAIGTDVDPLAVFVSRAKVRRYDLRAVDAASEDLKRRIAARRAIDEGRWGSFAADAPAEEVAAVSAGEGLVAPALPRIDHWFRRRAVYQLSALRAEVAACPDDEARPLLELCFASIIRSASNADPVPVSGLEVTSHMLAKEALGRVVDPYRLLTKALDRITAATAAFQGRRAERSEADALVADARLLNGQTVGHVDCVITSPPYLTAVDYYRRHTLEMYWLGLTDTHERRLEIMPNYIGRDRVGAKHLADAATAAASAVADRWLDGLGPVRGERERAFRHYCDGMARSLSSLREIVRPGGRIVVVAGDVRFRGRPVSMVQLMSDLAPAGMPLEDHLWYPIVNRYMSYARRNEANIAVDHVMVFGGGRGTA